MIKNFLIWLIKTLSVLLIASFIFSAITLDFPNLIKNVLGDVYAYSSEESQAEASERLAEACSSLGQGSLVSSVQICTNQTLRNQMEQSCSDYWQLRQEGIQPENWQEIERTCNDIDSGKLDSECKKQSSIIPNPDFSGIANLCKEYKLGKLGKQELFTGFLLSPFGNQNFSAPDKGVIGKYNGLMAFLKGHKFIYFAIIAILVSSLYLLISDRLTLLYTFAEISVSIGTIILLPYILIIFYNFFVGINTTSVLASIFGDAASIDFSGLLSILILLFLRTYNTFILTIGVICLSLGIFARVYVSKEKKKLKN